MNDQQESVIEAGVRVGFRDSDPQMRTVLTSAMKSGFNVVYTVVPRSGLTHTLCNFATDGLFGTHALLFISVCLTATMTANFTLVNIAVTCLCWMRSLHRPR